MERKVGKTDIEIFSLLFLGIALRYWCMTIGYNYDFESYCIVGKLAGNFHNVYAETTRYNYGPVFFCIQGLLYRFSFFLSTNPVLTYRVLLVSLLTLTDLGIALYIADQKSMRCAVCFFLNPISIIITGYHNQFDNIAILLALFSLQFYNEDDKLVRKDWLFILFMSLSLMTKHIFFLIPVFILLKRGLSLKKKMIYAVTPPFIFLISFVPFAICGEGAFRGIVNNVFLYRSYNNAPLLHGVFEMVELPDRFYAWIYMALMCIVGGIVRKRKFSDCVMIYLINMVAFASAIANQYLVIPMVALYVLEAGILKNAYIIAMTLFLFISEAGLGQKTAMIEYIPVLEKAIVNYEKSGYSVAAWILLFVFIYEMAWKKYYSKLIRAIRVKRKGCL